MITADTNVFVYLWDQEATVKRKAAQFILHYLSQRPDTKLALQVIGELQNVLRRKMKQPAFEAAQNTRNLLMAFETFSATEQNAQEALALMAAGRLSYWDAILVTASRDAGCHYFLSEDMADGFRMGSLTVINPFAEDGLSQGFKNIMIE